MLPSFQLPLVCVYFRWYLDMDNEQIDVLLHEITRALEKLETRIDVLENNYHDLSYDLRELERSKQDK
jgi:chaperonin cofactor prefoldin